MIFEHFHATGACEAVQCLSDVFSIRLQNDDVQDFYVRWAQALQSATELPTEMIREEIVSQNCRLQTVLALYDQETVRILALPSYQRSKAIRWLGRATSEPGTKGSRQEYWSRVTEVRTSALKVRECYQWKAKRTMFERRLVQFPL